jgi:hypothetical protein
VIPPRLSSNKRFSLAEIELNKKIAHSRIHIERAIRRAKEFKILTDIVPMNMVNNMSDIAQVVVYLTNFMGI